MKLPQILSILQNEPLLCANGYRATLLDIFKDHSELSRIEFQSKRTGLAKSGSLLDVDQAEIRDGVCVIPVGGPIGMNLGEFEKGAGAVDTDDIAAELEEADSNDEVEAIILNIDSPGGMVTGTPELGQKISDVEKPIYAFSRGTMASAAYWLACATDGIFATSSANIGCIGVCMSFLDLSKMADMAGIKVKVFGSGDYKGMGTPGTSLTPKQEILLQQRMTDLAQMFYSHVRANRGQIADEDMQGQTFRGNAAVERGLIDDTVPDLRQMIAMVK